MKNLLITRGLDLAAGKSMMSKDSLRLRSLSEFIKLECRDSVRGDKEECQVGNSSCDNNILVSCWSKVENNKNPQENFENIENSDLLLIAPSENIFDFLKNVRPYVLPKGYTTEPEHGEVNYYDPNYPPELLGSKIFEAYLYKRVHYNYQREYRFAFPCAVRKHTIQSIIISSPNLIEAIDGVVLNPKLSQEKRRELLDAAHPKWVKKIITPC